MRKKGIMYGVESKRKSTRIRTIKETGNERDQNLGEDC